MDLLVLAAGMGSRYGGLKQMDPVGPNGEFILDYSVRFAKEAGFDRVVFVIRKDIEKDFKEIVGSHWEDKFSVAYAIQDLSDLPEGFTLPDGRTKPWGTAHAVYAARNVVADTFVVVNADDFYGAEGFKLAYQYLKETESEPNTYCMVAYELSKTLSKYSGVSRGICEIDENSFLTKVTERLALRREDDGVIRDEGDAFADDTPVSMNLFGFKRSYMDALIARFPAFLKRSEGNPKAEYQMPTELSALLAAGDAKVKLLRTTSEWFGIASREDRDEVVEKLKNV
jgi:NDP-sugar pyrophosphorylase family protein